MGINLSNGIWLYLAIEICFERDCPNMAIFKRDAGFTLIELIFVIALMGIIIIISPLSNNFVNKSQLKTTVDTIVAELRWMQMQAILHNRPYRMYLYADGNYKIYYEDGADEITVKTGKYPDSLVLLKKSSGELEEVEDWVKLGFNELGHSSFPMTIAFRNNNGKVIKIIIGSWMGRISIETD